MGVEELACTCAHEHEKQTLTDNREGGACCRSRSAQTTECPVRIHRGHRNKTATTESVLLPCSNSPSWPSRSRCLVSAVVTHIEGSATKRHTSRQRERRAPPRPFSADDRMSSACTSRADLERTDLQRADLERADLEKAARTAEAVQRRRQNVERVHVIVSQPNARLREHDDRLRLRRLVQQVRGASD